MSSSTCLQEESSALREEKEALIRHCLAGGGACDSSVDLWRLRELALTKGGLVDAELRRRAWPILVGLNHPHDTTFDDDKHDNHDASLLNKKDLELIHCDAGRSVLFQYHKQSTTMACSSGESSSQHHVRYSDQREQLTDVLTRTLAGKHPWHYYQGLHDIAGVVLYTLQDAHDASAILSRLCQVHLRDALREDLNTLTSFVHAVLFPLIEMLDVELHDFFHECDLQASAAILPWILTWFTHDIHDAHVASRLVDAFLSAHPLFPLYMAVAILIHPQNRVEILTADWDAASIHVAIRRLTCKICGDWALPNEDCIAVQDLIDDAITIMRQHSPRSLLQLARIYSKGDCSSLCNMNHSVAFLRAPPAWAMASSMTMRHQHDKENTGDTANKYTTTLEQDGEFPTPRAKCASGVFFLMSTVDQEAVLSKRLEACSSSMGSSPRSVTTKWELCQQILFGDCSTEASCTFLT